MNFKTKAIGLFAGSALALSLAGGAMAQQADSTVVLTENDCAPGISTTEVDFGTYVYDADTGEFVPEGAGDGEASFSVTDSSGNRQSDCDIEIAASTLTDSNDANPITVTLDEDGADPANTGNPITVTVAPNGSATIGASLPATLDNTFSPDTYTGDITVTDASSGG